MALVLGVTVMRWGRLRIWFESLAGQLGMVLRPRCFLVSFWSWLVDGRAKTKAGLGRLMLFKQKQQ